MTFLSHFHRKLFGSSQGYYTLPGDKGLIIQTIEFCMKARLVIMDKIRTDICHLYGFLDNTCLI